MDKDFPPSTLGKLKDKVTGMFPNESQAENAGLAKKLARPLSVLFTVLMLFLRGMSTDKEEVNQAHSEATAANIQAFNANSALAKEKI